MSNSYRGKALPQNIDPAKFAMVTPLPVGVVIWKIFQEDLTKSNDFLADLYRRGYKVVKLEDGE